jgi:uncharacterized membrane protein YbhN (UPF0104 family)
MAGGAHALKTPARIALSAASLLAAGALLVALPYVVGAAWSDVGAVLGDLSGWRTAELVVLWLAGLAAYTWVLVASLPGLRHWQAFLLNTAGSAVSNVLPFGGAIGVALGYGMCRSWGFKTAAFAVSTLVTGVWNVLARLLLPAIGIAALLLAGDFPDRRLATAAGVGSALLIGIVTIFALALRSEQVAVRLQDVLVRLAARLPSRFEKRGRRIAESVLRLRHQTIGVLRTGWAGLTFGMIAYLTLQGVLLAACLGATGAAVGPAQTIAVFALNRLLSTAVVTPGGTGISETGTTALLIHFGAPAAPATAAALLYMVFVHTLEIPLGGVAAAGWALTRPR